MKRLYLLLLFISFLGICKAQPINDNCLNAVTLNVNSSCINTSGTVAGATDSGIEACSGTANDDVWYKFKAIGSVAEITVSTDFMDAVLEVFNAGCLGAQLVCRDQNTNGNTELVVLSNLVVGRYYYFRVHAYSPNNIYYTNFSVCVTGESEIPTGISNTDIRPISIYPNPASNLINVEAKNINSNIVRLKLVNHLGEVVYQSDESAFFGNIQTTINTETFPSGVYLLNFSDSDKSFDQKFIIE